MYDGKLVEVVRVTRAVLGRRKHESRTSYEAAFFTTAQEPSLVFRGRLGGDAFGGGFFFAQCCPGTI